MTVDNSGRDAKSSVTDWLGRSTETGIPLTPFAEGSGVNTAPLSVRRNEAILQAGVSPPNTTNGTSGIPAGCLVEDPQPKSSALEANSIKSTTEFLFVHATVCLPSLFIR